MSYNSIRPGQVWLDTNGNRIQAHGGSILYVDGTYYWYGENKEKTTSENDIWHWGVRCYASTDLYNWEDKGLIIPPEPDDPKSSMHPSSQMDRPHIIYNKDTKKQTRFIIMKQLTRDTDNKMIAGVCSGIANYLNVDPTVIRLIWAIAICFFGTGAFLYLIAWIIIPEKPNH